MPNKRATPPEILDFWFGPTDTVRPEWFRKDAAFDDEIRKRFGDAIEAALGETLEDWPDTPDARTEVGERVDIQFDLLMIFERLGNEFFRRALVHRVRTGLSA